MRRERASIKQSETAHGSNASELGEIKRGVEEGLMGDRPLGVIRHFLQALNPKPETKGPRVDGRERLKGLMKEGPRVHGRESLTPINKGAKS